jgi:hypothetical protein
MKFSEKDLHRIDIWVLKKDLEDSTLKTYLTCLRKYCTIIGPSPNELIEKADLEEENRH